MDGMSMAIVLTWHTHIPFSGQVTFLEKWHPLKVSVGRPMWIYYLYPSAETKKTARPSVPGCRMLLPPILAQTSGQMPFKSLGHVCMSVCVRILDETCGCRASRRKRQAWNRLSVAAECQTVKPRQQMEVWAIRMEIRWYVGLGNLLHISWIYSK